jgi:hypothetical protein
VCRCRIFSHADLGSKVLLLPLSNHVWVGVLGRRVAISFYGIGRDQLQRLLRRMRRALRIERRLTLEESYQLLELTQTITEHGRMHQLFYKHRMEYLMVETEELAFRFRETPETIEDALQILRALGRAEPYDRYGRWRLHLMKIDRDDAASA